VQARARHVAPTAAAPASRTTPSQTSFARRSFAGANAAAVKATRVVWGKKEGDADFAKVRSSAADVDDLKQDIAKALGLTERVSTLTLHVAETGKPLGPALDSAAGVAPISGEVKSSSRFVIRVAAASAAVSERAYEVGLHCFRVASMFVSRTVALPSSAARRSRGEGRAHRRDRRHGWQSPRASLRA